MTCQLLFAAIQPIDDAQRNSLRYDRWVNMLVIHTVKLSSMTVHAQSLAVSSGLKHVLWMLVYVRAWQHAAEMHS